MAQSAFLDDFTRFKSEPSTAAREDLTIKICEQFNARTFSPQEEKIVKDILSFLSQDVEKKIRKALAETLKQNADLPHAIAIRLAKDMEEIASPILEFSEVLTDSDLEAIIKSAKDVGKLEAIARRSSVSPRISDQLVKTNHESVVVSLFDNEHATISEKTLMDAVALFKDSNSVMETLIERGNLSVRLVDKMISLVSGALQKKLAAKHGVDPVHTLRDNKEKVTLNVLSKQNSPERVTELVEHLHKKRELSHSIIFRALCRADMDFFETAIAKRASIPVPNVSKLIYKGDRRAIIALFNAANIPGSMIEPAVTLLHLMTHEYKPEKNLEIVDYLKNLLATLKEKQYDTMANMQYFLSLLCSTIDSMEASPIDLE